MGNREIKRPRICHDFKTANFNSRKFKWGYSMVNQLVHVITLSNYMTYIYSIY